MPRKQSKRTSYILLLDVRFVPDIARKLRRSRFSEQTIGFTERIAGVVGAEIQMEYLRVPFSFFKVLAPKVYICMLFKKFGRWKLSYPSCNPFPRLREDRRSRQLAVPTLLNRQRQYEACPRFN